MGIRTAGYAKNRGISRLIASKAIKVGEIRLPPSGAIDSKLVDKQSASLIGAKRPHSVGSLLINMKLAIIAYCFAMMGSCFAQSSPKDSGILSPHGVTRTSVYHGDSVATSSALGIDDRPMTIFKDEMNKDSGNQGHLSDRPLLSPTPKQSFGNMPSADRGGVNQGYVGPFNTPSNNPKGAYIGIDVPLFGK